MDHSRPIERHRSLHNVFQDRQIDTFSARSFLSRVFSFSSCWRRFAGLSSNPPSSRRHRS